MPDIAARSVYRLKGLVFFIPFSLAVIGLGIWGFIAADPATGCHADSFGDAVFRTVMVVFRLGTSCAAGKANLPVQLELAGAILPWLGAAGAAFALARVVVQNVRHDAQLALVHAMRGHIVIIGLGETGMEAARQLKLQRQKPVAIALAADGQPARDCAALGIPVIPGDATLPETLASAGLARARAAIIATGADAMNLEICLAIGALPRRPQTVLKLYPEIRGGWVSRALREWDSRALGEAVQLHPFRARELIARGLLRRPAFASAGSPPRLLFIGFGELARAILLRAIACNYALPGLRPEILCLDQLPRQSLETDGLEGFADFAHATHQFGAEAADAQILAGAPIRFRPDIAIVTLPEDAMALRVANALREMLDRHGQPIPAIFVQVRREKRLCGLLAGMAALPFCPDRLRGFGDLSEVMAPDALLGEELDKVAQAIHEAYLATAPARTEASSPAQVAWGALAERFRQDNRAAADFIAVNLADSGYFLCKGPGPSAALPAPVQERMAAAEHFRWMRAQMLAGARPGAARDEFRRTHDLMLPWEALPEPMRAANRDRIAAIPETLRRAGLRVLRLAPGGAPPGGAPPDPTEIPLFELESESDADWQAAEERLRAGAGLVRLRRRAAPRAERLRELARRYPAVAAAAIAWR